MQNSFLVFVNSNHDADMLGLRDGDLDHIRLLGWKVITFV